MTTIHRTSEQMFRAHHECMQEILVFMNLRWPTSSLLLLASFLLLFLISIFFLSVFAQHACHRCAFVHVRTRTSTVDRTKSERSYNRSAWWGAFIGDLFGNARCGFDTRATKHSWTHRLPSRILYARFLFCFRFHTTFDAISR